MPFLNTGIMHGGVDHLIDLALSEDIGAGDVTTRCLPKGEAKGKGRIIAKEEIVLAGMEVAQRVFSKLDPCAQFLSDLKDGDVVYPKGGVAEVVAPMNVLLMAERTALNFLQRMSGIATHVRRYVNKINGRNVRLVDTRKTIPGWRTLEKYAVRVGGAHNHRMGLYDGVLIKDNHIAAFGGILPAVSRIRQQVSHLMKIEVETSTLKEVEEAVAAGADIIMLDNMSLDEIKTAVSIINRRALVEVSGRVNLDNLAMIADTGVDIISVGALIHAAVFVDISMTIEGTFDSPAAPLK